MKNFAPVLKSRAASEENKCCAAERYEGRKLSILDTRHFGHTVSLTELSFNLPDTQMTLNIYVDGNETFVFFSKQQSIRPSLFWNVT
jgi:hypothetical protein